MVGFVMTRLYRGEMAAKPLEQALDRLYALPPEQFTAARNAEAKRLGDAEVQGLRRPTLAAWVVNQLARRSPGDLAKVVAGDLEPVARLRGLAKKVLAERGKAVPAAVLTRVEGTLRAAPGAEKSDRVLIEKGRLDEELTPGGFGLSSALPRPRARAHAKAAPPPPPPPKKREPSKRDVAAERAAEKRMKAALAKAEKRVEKERSSVARAEETLRASRERLLEAERAALELRRAG
jgi:hypothetical protein